MPVTRRVVRHQFSVPAPVLAWSPLSLPSLVAWYKADAGVTGSPVSQWDDQSGNGHHLTAAGTARPTTGVVTQNSLPGITFDATNNQMSVTGAVSEAPTNRYVFMVFQATTLLNNATLLTPGSNDGYEYRVGTGDSGFGAYRQDILESGIAHHGADTGTVFATTTYLYEVRLVPNEIKFFRNSSLVGTNTQSFTFGSGGSTYTVGSNRLDATLFEWGIADTAISSGDQASLQSYASTKWAY